VRDRELTVGPRRRAREIALQILHQMDVGGDPQLEAKQMIARYFAHLAPETAPVSDVEEGGGGGGDSAARVDRALVDELVGGVANHRAEIDSRLTTLSRNWRLERMGIVERNVIRIALYELGHAPNVPVPVIINEAVELTKRYGTAEGVAFVNGLLDRAATEMGRT
jgi:transcription antitermination protein NusB